MIVDCPSCSARFSLDLQRLGGKRVTLRCLRCREIFKVEVPGSGSVPRFQALVAHSDPSLCAAIAEVLAEGGLSCRLCHDGPAALRSMDNEPPHILVIDVALPGLFAFEVVERIRSRPGLERVKVILLSSVYKRAAYKRTPSSLYGADDYIEKHHIPDDLVPKIHRLLSNYRPLEPQKGFAKIREPKKLASEPLSLAALDELNSKILLAEEGEVSPKGTEEAMEKAKRLARIIVSDIALYNQERVEEGIRSGKFFQLLAKEIEEGRRLFSERVSSALLRREDFLQNAFLAFIEKRRRELQPQPAGEVV